MNQKECMMICVVSINIFVTFLMMGKITNLEKRKTDTFLYDMFYKIAYPLMGIAAGTVLAYLIN